jgi:hypothetical protein
MKYMSAIRTTEVRMMVRYSVHRQPRYDCETAPPMIGPRVGPATNDQLEQFLSLPTAREYKTTAAPLSL